MLLTGILLSSVSFAAFGSDEILITTDGNRAKRNGTWSVSANSVVARPTGGTRWHSSTPCSSMEFDASKLKNGRYGVYVFMTPWGKTADKMDVVVTASGKSTAITIACKPIGDGNRHWVILG